MTRVLALAVLAVLSGCASLPTSGPTANQVVSGLQPGEVEVIAITPSTPSGEAADAEALAGWTIPDGSGANDRVTPGDRLMITVYEVGYSLFGNAGSATDTAGALPSGTTRTFPTLVVPDSGQIRFPYAGTIYVNGLSSDAVARAIEQKLRGKSQYLQVMAVTEPGPGRSALIGGDVAKPGRVTLTSDRERLLDLVALAGGPTARKADTVVRLARGRFISEARLDAIGPNGGENVVVAPGDRIELLRSPRTLTVLGAAQKVSEVPFDGSTMTLSEAIARTGGPLDERADARGVFIFRYERRERDGQTVRQPVIYRLDLMDPAAYFAAQQFAMRPKDVMLIANARTNQIEKFLRLVSALSGPVVTGVVLTQ
ncbi:polysaccharide export outer membrane protein [Novosphingobium kunmingense]|uniref:Polysaccharide export outer membrane protein n=1 Tax=Novosphingobium kunmingense TaxID=1211806 RepID=A0A2N0HJ90_9SPHN|nr:polysaccharide biosynthesis/export family protein [Novosphingobium kunmingense]PKB19003.1 polysaccharide export outer membrane protein [Novosphingobium kunmingense]